MAIQSNKLAAIFKSPFFWIVISLTIAISGAAVVAGIVMLATEIWLGGGLAFGIGLLIFTGLVISGIVCLVISRITSKPEKDKIPTDTKKPEKDKIPTNTKLALSPLEETQRKVLKLRNNCEKNIFAGDLIEELRKDQNYDPNHKYQDGKTLLQIALEVGDSQLHVVKFLLNHEKFDLKSLESLSLKDLVKSKKYEILNEFLCNQKTENIFKKESLKDLFKFACIMGDFKTIKILLDCNRINVNEKIDGETLFEVAYCDCSYNDGLMQPIVELLLEKKFDFSSVRTEAMYFYNRKIVKELLQNQEIKNKFDKDDLKNVLYRACLKCDYETIRLLLDCNQIDVNEKLGGSTLFEVVCGNSTREAMDDSRWKIVRLLIEKNFNFTSISIAGFYNFSRKEFSNKVIQELLQNQKTKNKLKKEDLHSLLSKICDAEDLEMLEVLKNHDICKSDSTNKRTLQDFYLKKSRNKDGRTDAHRGCQDNNVKQIKELLINDSCGSFLKEHDNKGLTPIDLAYDNNAIDIINLLITEKVLDFRSIPPISKFYEKKNFKLVNYFLDKYPSNICEGDIASLLRVACKETDIETIKKLLVCKKIQENNIYFNYEKSLLSDLFNANQKPEVMCSLLKINSPILDASFFCKAYENSNELISKFLLSEDEIAQKHWEALLPLACRKNDLPVIKRLIDMSKNNELQQAYKKASDNAQKAENKNLILVLGSTGAGKSTFFNYLHDCPIEKIHSSDKYYAKAGDPVKEYSKIVHGNEIGTKFPVIKTHAKHGFTYCDCPPLGDITSEEKKIIGSINTLLTIAKAKTIRAIVVVVDYMTMCIDHGELFKQAIKKLAAFVEAQENKKATICPLIFTIRYNKEMHKNLDKEQVFSSIQRIKDFLESSNWQNNEKEIKLLSGIKLDHILLLDVFDKGESKHVFFDLLDKNLPNSNIPKNIYNKFTNKQFTDLEINFEEGEGGFKESQEEKDVQETINELIVQIEKNFNSPSKNKKEEIQKQNENLINPNMR